MYISKTVDTPLNQGLSAVGLFRQNTIYLYYLHMLFPLNKIQKNVTTILFQRKYFVIFLLEIFKSIMVIAFNVHKAIMSLD